MPDPSCGKAWREREYLFLEEGDKIAKKKRRPSGPPARPIPKQVIAELAEAERRISRGQAAAALELLRSLDQVYPNREEILSEMLRAYQELKEFRHYQSVCERLLRLLPNDPELTMALAGSCMLNVRPALALRTYQRFLECWPNHERAEEARTILAELEPELRMELVEMGLTGDEAIEVAAIHEEGQSLLQEGRYAQARRVEEEMLRRQPDFVPALNNISLTYWIESDLDAAMATSQRVLAIEPDNYHALANLTHYLCVSGRIDEARQYAEQLKRVETTRPDVWTKKAEAFSYLGDDEAVLAALNRARQTDSHTLPQDEALLYHLAAVAAMRLSREDEARRHWQQCLKLSPRMELAQANLADLRLPVGERNAPWAFGFQQWAPHKALRDLAGQVVRASRREKEGEITRTVQRYLGQHPRMVTLLSILLDRGDPEGRRFAMGIAVLAEMPETLAVLRDFVMSRRGPDELRLEAAQAAVRGGVLASAPVPMWVDGERREVMAVGFEISSEPVRHHSPQVEDWLREAALALREHNPRHAERLLRQALEVEPEAPDILNNLAAAFEQQGHADAGHKLVRWIYERHPDYLFARISMAQLFIREGKLDEGEALLKPLLEERRFHFSEFSALCQAHIELLLARGNPDGARSWLEMWAAADPDHPAIERVRRRLGQPAGRRRLPRQRR